MRASVTVAGYTRRLNVIAFVKLIREMTGESLAPAKDRVDALLEEGKAFQLDFADSEAADAFSRAATDIGAIVTQKEVIDSV